MKWLNEGKRNGFFVPGEAYQFIDREVLAYVAGLFDGEGSISFQRNSKTLYIRASISNTDRAVLEFLQQTFGGSVVTLKRVNPEWKVGQQWILTWSRAVLFLKAIQPWSRVKSAQIEVGLRWGELRPGSGKWTPDVTQQRVSDVEALRLRLKWLNHRGSSDRGPEPLAGAFSAIGGNSGIANT